MPLTHKVVTELLQSRDTKLAGSIYIATQPQSSSQTISADRTRFKNALQQIRGLGTYDDKILANAFTELDKLYENIEFWKHQDNGLAVFFSDDTFVYFHLPFEPTEAAYLDDHYIVSPLLIMEAVDTSFYVLDVNFTQPRLFHGHHGRLEQVNRDSMPLSLDEEFGKDEYQKQLQHSPAGTSSYHGHSEEDAVSDEAHRYLKKLAEVVDTYLADEDAPLLLAGTDNRVGNLKKQLTYKHVSSEGLTGNVERHSTEELYAESAPLISEYHTKSVNDAAKRLNDAAPQFVAIGQKEIQEILDGESGGRIENLYLPTYRLTKDGVRAGDNTSLIIELPDDIDTIESLVCGVISHGGSIIPVEIGAYDFLDKPKALCRY